MSVQRPALGGLLRRSTLLAVGLGLVALLAGCESEQTGYDVAVPLLGPTGFDETSCEGSGDLCNDDDGCIYEEDGVLVDDGPCTKTMESLEPITVPFSLSPSNPSYNLGFVDTNAWTNLFLAQQFADGEVPEGARIVMTTDGFSLQGGPVTIAVEISSRQGLIAGQPRSYTPVTPSSCTFVLDSGSTGQDYADGINTCLSDWVDTNGAPVEFDMTVTSSAGAAQAAALKSGLGPKQLTEYQVDGNWQMRSENQCDFDGTLDALEAVREGEDFFAQLACERLSLQGSGRTDQAIDIVGGALVWDRCGNFSGAALLPTSLAAGPYTVSVLQSGAVTGDVPVVFIPQGVDFAESLLGAATGKCLSGTPVFADGRGIAGWMHCGPEPPPTRTGFIEVSATGFCSVVGGSDVDAGTDPDASTDLDASTDPDASIDPDAGF